MRDDDEEELARFVSPVGGTARADGDAADGSAAEGAADRLASCKHCRHWKDEHDGLVAVPWSGGYMRCANCMVCEAILLTEDSILSMM